MVMTTLAPRTTTTDPLTDVLEELHEASGGVAPAGALLAVVAAVGAAACAAAFRPAETARR